MKRAATTWIASCTCAASLGIESCATTTETVKGDDGSALCLAARVRVPISKSTGPVGPPEAAQRPIGRSELWIDASRSSGSDAQDVGAGHQIVLDGVTFAGPDRVESTMEFSRLAVSLAAIAEFEESFALSAVVGLVFLERELRLDSASQSASDDARTAGLDFGVEFDWRRPRQPMLAYGRFHAALAGGSSTGTDQRIVELGFGWAFDEHFQLRAGWRHWSWIEGRDGADSDLDYSLSGPVLTLDARL